MSNIIATLQQCPITLNDDGTITVTAKAAIDDDGSNNASRDPDWQQDTSLHFPARPNPAGKPIDADKVPYAVAPPVILYAVTPMVLGCRVHLRNRRNGRECEAVCADVGPHTKIGEISMEAARRLGIPPSPTTGGEDSHVVEYTFFPGAPAVVDGRTYELQHSHA